MLKIHNRTYKTRGFPRVFIYMRNNIQKNILNVDNNCNVC